MIHIALFEPEIPANSGNIIRLAANTGAHVHWIEPIGFKVEDKYLKRAGLDYHDLTTVTRHANMAAFQQATASMSHYAFSTHATEHFNVVDYPENVVLLFGPESRGLPPHLLHHYRHSLLRLPMVKSSRSLNLSNAVAVAVYEVWRQHQYCGSTLLTNL